MWCYKKKDILKEMGKGEKDVRALDRLIRYGKVIVLESWGKKVYVRREEYEDSELIRLRRRVQELEGEVSRLNEEISWLSGVDRWEVEDDVIDSVYRFLRSRRIMVEEDDFKDGVKELLWGSNVGWGSF